MLGAKTEAPATPDGSGPDRGLISAAGSLSRRPYV